MNEKKYINSKLVMPPIPEIDQKKTEKIILQLENIFADTTIEEREKMLPAMINFLQDKLHDTMQEQKPQEILLLENQLKILKPKLEQSWDKLYKIAEQEKNSSKTNEGANYFSYMVLRLACFREVFNEIFETDKMNRLLESSLARNQKDFILNWSRNAGTKSDGIPVGAIGGLIFFLEAMIKPMHEKNPEHPVFEIYTDLKEIFDIIKKYGENTGICFHDIKPGDAINSSPHVRRENHANAVLNSIVSDNMLFQTFQQWAKDYLTTADRGTNDIIVNVSALGYKVLENDQVKYEEKSYVSTFNDIAHIL